MRSPGWSAAASIRPISGRTLDARAPAPLRRRDAGSSAPGDGTEPSHIAGARPCCSGARSDRSTLRAAIRNATSRPDAARKRSRLQDLAASSRWGSNSCPTPSAGATEPAQERRRLSRWPQIALLAVRPFRKRNFADLRIGTHLVRDGGAWWLILRPEETKTQQPVEVPFPDDSSRRWNGISGITAACSP